MGIPKTNLYQVGGTHYRAEYQHWDWAEDIGLGYLESVATKYLLPNRRAQKGGLEDLKKALHYIKKLIELQANGRTNRRYAFQVSKRMELIKQDNLNTEKMCDQASCPDIERSIIYCIMNWIYLVDLESIEQQIESLIQINEGNPTIDPEEKAELRPTCPNCLHYEEECECDKDDMGKF